MSSHMLLPIWFNYQYMYNYVQSKKYLVIVIFVNCMLLGFFFYHYYNEIVVFIENKY